MSVPDGLLVLLREEPKHGYQLATDFGTRTGGRWVINTGQVYTTLDRLERDGFVTDDEPDPDDARRRRVRLTDAGLVRAERWLQEAPPDAAPRDELVLRVLLVAAVDRDEAQRVIDGQRAELVVRLQALRKAQRRAPEEGLVARMAADAAAVRIEAEIRWLDLCEQRLRTHPTEEDS